MVWLYTLTSKVETLCKILKFWLWKVCLYTFWFCILRWGSHSSDYLCMGDCPWMLMFCLTSHVLDCRLRPSCAAWFFGIFFVFLLFVFEDIKVLLCNNSSWSGTCSLVQASLELMAVLRPQPLKCWYNKCGPPYTNAFLVI